MAGSQRASAERRRNGVTKLAKKKKAKKPRTVIKKTSALGWTENTVVEQTEREQIVEQIAHLESDWNTVPGAQAKAKNLKAIAKLKARLVAIDEA